MNRSARSIHKPHWTAFCHGSRCRAQYAFYALSTQPTLFGEISLIRIWGRIGTVVQTFDGSADAIEAFRRLERAKRRRVYVAVDEKLSQSGNFSGITALPVIPALSVPRP
ncbi:WGR domain-containing protein [Bradyrhizobium sp. 195]|uniref:WGR domain-containing protein n=1 Tax=Bradyrhizobium sp. 195 TaxID=2782662 RepID=UPI002000E6F8|nr:WGR domain-containing protein [Bradyrhizobium sp. 195]UPK31496.1 WGR domain-containing protein [Bradyrhizobium sp. 195]